MDERQLCFKLRGKPPPPPLNGSLPDLEMSPVSSIENVNNTPPVRNIPPLSD